MVEVQVFLDGALLLMRLVVFGMALGLTLISFQAYREKQSQQLQYAFIGFAFISMGVALTAIVGQVAPEAELTTLTILRTIETIPFIIGFAMIYLSLYR
jgi:hypothetical protein